MLINFLGAERITVPASRDVNYAEETKICSGAILKLSNKLNFNRD